MKAMIVSLFFIAGLLTGCETVHEGAQEVGKPIGSVFKTVGGVTEGAAEGYSDKEGDNPYNR